MTLKLLHCDYTFLFTKNKVCNQIVKITLYKIILLNILADIGTYLKSAESADS